MRHIAPEKTEEGTSEERRGEMGEIRGRVEVVGSYEDWGVNAWKGKRNKSFREEGEGKREERKFMTVICLR